MDPSDLILNTQINKTENHAVIIPRLIGLLEESTFFMKDSPASKEIDNYNNRLETLLQEFAASHEEQVDRIGTLIKGAGRITNNSISALQGGKAGG